MTDAPSRPHSSPARCPKRLERRIVKLRYCRRWGPHRISYHLGVPRSTVGRVLARYRMPLLAHLDQATGLPVRQPKPVLRSLRAGKARPRRHQEAGPHPRWGRLAMRGRGSAPDRRAAVVRQRAYRAGAAGSRGYVFLHHAVDDYTRLAYSEQLPDERTETATAFWRRANAFFNSAGIAVTAVMTDNGPCSRSRVRQGPRTDQAPSNPALPSPDHRQSASTGP